MMPGRVHVVDDDASFRTAIERSLKHAGYEVETYASAQQLMDCPPVDGVPGCILIDVRIPGISGPELQVHLRELGSTLPIIFSTESPDIRTTVRVIKAGAEDFLVKPISSDELLRSVDRAIAKHRSNYRQKMILDVNRSLLSTLTPREREVFELVTRGNTSKQIAHVLGCTERTVKAHRQRVMKKTRARSLPDLVSLAERVGMALSEDREARPVPLTGSTGDLSDIGTVT
jgi:RNA polymerase sigma factor (sigma-70 family)